MDEQKMRILRRAAGVEAETSAPESETVSVSGGDDTPKASGQPSPRAAAKDPKNAPSEPTATKPAEASQHGLWVGQRTDLPWSPTSSPKLGRRSGAVPAP
jgi:hypothetical protein